MRGADVAGSSITGSLAGEPPRARGRPAVVGLPVVTERRTPACAGPTPTG